MSDKRLAAKRIWIYVLFSCGIFWILAGLCDLLGILQDDAGFQLVSALGMLTPAIGSLLTRLVTKEGIENSLLRLNLKGNVRYYVLAFVIPLIYSALEVALYAAILGARFDPAAFLRSAGISPLGYIAALLFNIAMSAALFPFFLGEELGWRGYLYPKLRAVTGRPAAYVIGGIVWGIWHFPAIIDGLNFGKDYSGYPYVGVLLMCIYCVFTGIIFAWLTEKTNSVFPAAFAHAVNNNATSLIIGTAELDTDKSGAPTVFLVGTLAVGAIAAICAVSSFFPALRDRKK